MSSTPEQAMQKIGVTSLTPEAVIDRILGPGSFACYQRRAGNPAGVEAFRRFGQMAIDAALGDNPDENYRYASIQETLRTFWSRDMAPVLNFTGGCGSGGGSGTSSAVNFSLRAWYAGPMGTVYKVAAGVATALAVAGGITMLFEGGAAKAGGTLPPGEV